MSTFRSYLSKQSTLISGNSTNNSANPIFELVAGNNIYSRYIFTVDLSNIRANILKNNTVSGNVTEHTLVFYSAIAYRDDLIGKTYVNGMLRNSQYELQLFKIDEEFAEGISYDFDYLDNNVGVPNWYFKDKINNWNIPGIYSGSTSAITTQFFNKGNEDINFNVTSLINDTLFNTTADTINLGISYPISYETGTTSGDSNTYITTFFSKETQSFFEPHIKTVVNDYIKDDRNKFYLDSDNNLLLYVNDNVNVDSINSVQIFDYNDDLVTTVTGNSITNISKNIYSINLNIPSSTYPDMVNFSDKWNITINGINKIIENEFTLITQDISYNFDNQYENSMFSFGTYGINHGEKINPNNGSRKILVKTKRLYNSSIVDEIAIDGLTYEVYTLQGKNQINVIDETPINITPFGNYLIIDFSWFIPQDYYLAIKVKFNGITYSGSKVIKFSVV